MEAAKDVYFNGVPQPVRVFDCMPLLPLLPEIFPTWPFEVRESDPVAPIITVCRERREYCLSAPWLDAPLRTDTEVGLFADLVVDLIHAWLEANQGLRCLHAAAVEYAGRLVLFPNSNKAGKSLLAAWLMAEQQRCYGDDLVALLPDGSGQAFGVPPRLRLPLPASEPGLVEYVRRNGGLADRQCQYLSSTLPELARFGETRPLGAVVMLARQPQGPAELVPADPAGSLRNLVYQHFMRQGSALEVLNGSGHLIRTLPCWHLRYARLDDASACLRRAFLEGEQPGFVVRLAPQAVSPASTSVRPTVKKRSAHRRRTSTQRFVRCPGVLVREEAGEAFLVQASGDQIFHLNRTGRAVWELLAEPCSEAEAAGLLIAAFPDADPALIERDVVTLFVALRKNRLLQ